MNLVVRLRKRRHYEFSKIIIVYSNAFLLLVTILSFILMFKVGDLTPLTYIIPSVATGAATSCGFYFWKSKAENIIKLRKQHGELAEDIENVS